VQADEMQVCVTAGQFQLCNDHLISVSNLFIYLLETIKFIFIIMPKMFDRLKVYF